jgi:hypothetical protein
MKFNKNNFVRINCKKKDLLEIGILETDAKKLLNKLGLIVAVWGENKDKYNVKFSDISNNGYNYCFEEWMLKKN